MRIIFLKLLFFIVTLLSTLDATTSCYKDLQSVKLLESKEQCIALDKEKQLCLKSEVIKRYSKDALKYQVFCINGQRIASGYPKLQRFTKVAAKGVSDFNITVTNRYITLTNAQKMLFYNLQKGRFVYSLDFQGIKNIYPLADNLLLIEGYFKKSNSIDVALCQIDNNITTVIKTPYDDYVRDIYYNNNFILEQLKVDASQRGSKEANLNGSKVHYKTLPFKERGSYILDKHLNIISFKRIDLKTKKSIRFSDLEGKLVHGGYSILILLLSLLSIFIVFKLLKALVGSFKLPTITTLYMLSYLVFVYIGAVALNFFYFEYEFNTHLYERRDLLLNIWYAATAGLFLIVFGAFFAKKVLLPQRACDFNKFFEKDIAINFRQERLYLLIWIIFLIALVAFYLYYRNIGHIPIFSLFQDLTPEQLAKLRSDSGNNFDGHLYRFVTFYKDIPLFLLMVLFFLKNFSKKWKILFILLFLYNAFIAVMDLQKAPLVNIFLLLILVYFYLEKQINWKKLFSVIVISFLALLIMYTAFMGVAKHGFIETLQAPLHRAFIGSISPLFWWQLYIEQHGFLYGASLPNPHNILNFEHINISEAVMDFAHTELRDKGIVGSMPVVFFAEWFANYGWGVALLSMFGFGVLLYTLDTLFVSRMLKKKRAILLAMYLYIMFYFMHYSVSSVSGILFDTHLIVPIILGYLLYKITETEGQKP